MTEQEMWQAYCLQNHIAEDSLHDSWKFCGGGEMGDALARLALEGTKTATAAMKAAYDSMKLPLPQVGEYGIVLYDNDQAACIIRLTKVSLTPFGQVSAEHAFREGEGDRSLESWRRDHRAVYKPFCEQTGLSIDDDTLFVLAEFERVYPGKTEKME